MEQQVENLEKVQELSTLEFFAKFMEDGGIFMWIILGIWALGVAIASERFRSYLKFYIDGSSFMNKIKADVLNNKVHDAIVDCGESKSLLAHVLRSGLKRANQDKEKIMDALEGAIIEATSVIDKRLSYLALIANVSTLIGLLGTIYGLIQSFAAVASADAAQKAELLALGISKAMNTTAFGLISAISIMVLHVYLSNRANQMATDFEQYSVKLVDLLNHKSMKRQVSEAA
ncbi:MAG: MotA/TolQ/ExbB proton channel family protein [Bacteriovoracaceae bacterium]|jgi:biopolymer transport protein ExbB/TolQ|nr:MotA/TolQ/ExbB proton channel family protein [Bacteriovoracaceae bacterium]